MFLVSQAPMQFGFPGCQQTDNLGATIAGTVNSLTMSPTKTLW